MKWVLLGTIYLYRWLPTRFKRQCLFKETCSFFVARVTCESGFWRGMSALRTRVSQCQPGYRVYFESEVKNWQVRLRDGSVSTSADLAEFVLSPYRDLSWCSRLDSDGAIYPCDTNVLMWRQKSASIEKRR